jgi:hypothetical protein
MNAPPALWCYGVLCEAVRDGPPCCPQSLSRRRLGPQPVRVLVVICDCGGDGGGRGIARGGEGAEVDLSGKRRKAGEAGDMSQGGK